MSKSSTLTTVSAFKIDAVNKTVTAIEIPVNDGCCDLDTMYKEIGCDCFTCAQFARGKNGGSEDVFVDDNGLLTDPQHFFTIAGYPSPLAGNGIVLGTDEEGNSTDSSLTLERVKKIVSFYDRNEIVLRNMQ